MASFQIIFAALTLGAILLIGAYFIPWRHIDWGTFQIAPAKTITVTGEAESKEKTQVAAFTAGVDAIHDDKDTAVKEVNRKIKDIIESVKSFGIKDEDIQTQNLSVYRTEETYYDEGRQKQRPGQWRVNNSINITLRDVDRASALADLLAESGATNVYGPNFSMEDTKEAEKSLLEGAIANAREKAEVIAKSTGGKSGKIISVSEGSQPVGIYRPFEGAGGGGAPVEPGSVTVTKFVTVVFELK